MTIFLLLLLCLSSFRLSKPSSDIFNPIFLSSLDDPVLKAQLLSDKVDHSSSSLLPLPLNDLQYHGTTTLAFVFKDSIIVAVDSMASVGAYVGSRTVRKIFPVGNRVVATMAGGAADCAYWIRNTATQVKRLEYQCGVPLQTVVYAKLLAASMREYRGKDLSLGTMVAGWHPETGPECKILYNLTHLVYLSDYFSSSSFIVVFYVDSTGACVGPGRCFSVGSGSSVAYSVIDDALAKMQASGNLEEAIDLASWAIKHATHRDSYSGGFINIFKIDQAGCHHLKRIDSRSLTIKH